MKFDHRTFRLAASVVALLSAAIAAWVYSIGQLEVITLGARERTVQAQCLAYGIAEGAWIANEPYCLARIGLDQGAGRAYTLFYPDGMIEESMHGSSSVEVTIAIPLDQAAEFMQQFQLPSDGSSEAAE